MKLKSILQHSRIPGFIFGGALLLSVGCAHHRDVRAGADGVHRVVVQAEDKDEGAQDAIAQANHFCKEKGLSAGFLEEDKKYTGDLNESDYKTGKTVSKVAQAAGGAMFVFGGKKESQVGGVMGVGGGIANAALGKGYTVEMRFKCVK